MSKTISGGMQTHLAGGLTTVCMAWKIVRLDGEAFYFTDHDVDLLIDGNTYKASTGMVPSAISQQRDLSVDNQEVVAFLDDTSIVEADIMAGLWDYADVSIYLVNYAEYEVTEVT